MLRQTLRTLAALTVGLLAPAAMALSPSQLTAVEFQHTLDVGFGNSIFVSGSVPELGGGSIPLAPKLVYTAGAVWRAPIALVPGTTVTYRMVNRTDSAGTVGNPGNGTYLTAEITTTVPGTISPPLPASKTLVYLTAWTSPSLEVETTPGNYTTVTMTMIGPGRSPAEKRWRATGFGTPGRSVKFRLTDGLGNYDYSPGGGLYDTFLDIALLQDGNLFNYEPAPSVSASRIEVISNVASPQGLLARSLRVYLPRGYDEHTTRSYPVFYMHDGQNIYGTTGGGFPPVRWNVDGTLNRLIRQGQVREIIVVGIDNTADRITDYTPPGAPMGGISGGEGDLYLAYVRDTVRPLINSTYRTLTGPSDTGTGGSSLGGIISTYFGLEAPGTFARIAAVSPAYWVNLNVVTRLSTDSSLPSWRHYMDSGTAGSSNDGFNDTVNARDRMLLRGQAINREVLHVVGFGEEHNETAWQNRFPGVPRYLFPIEDEPNSVNTSGAATSVSDWPLY